MKVASRQSQFVMYDSCSKGYSFKITLWCATHHKVASSQETFRWGKKNHNNLVGFHLNLPLTSLFKLLLTICHVEGGKKFCQNFSVVPNIINHFISTHVHDFLLP